MIRTFDEAQRDANYTYDVIRAEVILATKGDEQAANIAASRAYTGAMTAWYADEAYTDQRAVIAARNADAHQHDANQVSLPDMMLATGRIDHAQWMAKVWPTLPEEAY